MKTFRWALLALVLSSCATPGGESAREQVAAATDAWAAAFNDRDPARLAALYDADAILWGTAAKAMATTPAAIHEYFKILPKLPSARVTFGEQKIRVLGDVAVNTGYYTFTFPKTEWPSRYSMVFKYRDGKWLIVDHHSSRIPQ